MNIPNAEQAVVDRDKITDYLLCPQHPTGASKAEFFCRFGFTLKDWRRLADALRAHGARCPVVKSVASEYGIRYIVDGALETPDGRNPRVRSVWISAGPDFVPRLITAHPI